MAIANLRKQTLGSYYTPEPVANAMAQWVTSVTDPMIFEPGFGGCVFLNSIRKCLQKKGVTDVNSRLFGVDIDPRAFQHLKNVFGNELKSNQFMICDFMSVTKSTFGIDGFSALIGNPPYIRHHDIQEDLKRHAKQVLSAEGLSISGMASYWASFLLHSLTLLKTGARLALVLPGAFIYADYAREIRQQLCKNFKNVYVIIIGERVFEGVEEETVLLLADGWNMRNIESRIGFLEKSSDVLQICTPENICLKELEVIDSPEKCLLNLLDADAAAVYKEISLHPYVSRLGTYARVKIGVVTGANDFFVIKSHFAQSFDKDFLLPIVTHSSFLKGIIFSANDFSNLIINNKPCYLLSLPKEVQLSSRIEEYLNEGLRQGIHLRYKCRNRAHWYCISDDSIPTAFLTYMSGRRPRIILNQANTVCTNAIHRLYPANNHSVNDLKACAVASLSTLFQLSAELVGRSYGGGVLKIEPSESRNLLIPMIHDVHKIDLNIIDDLVRRQEFEVASRMVDEELLVNGLHISPNVCKKLRSALNILRSIRLKGIAEPSGA